MIQRRVSASCDVASYVVGMITASRHVCGHDHNSVIKLRLCRTDICVVSSAIIVVILRHVMHVVACRVIPVLSSSYHALSCMTDPV